MTAKTEENKVDYRPTILLPQTEFPMRAGLPVKEPELLARWEKMAMYRRLRDDAKGREKYILHDGPPYANGNIHIGHALNKILKDVIVRAMQMQGYDSNYVPGWDCHGLPIEWKIEEQYRAKGKNKDDVPVNEFRKECREFAAHWIAVQTEEFKRLGVEGDFETPYTTMAFSAEAAIAVELMKFARSGQLYRGSKPIMWSVVERTALAEAEVEYQDYESDTVWVKFPIQAAVTPDNDSDAERINRDQLLHASIVIWTTTPWTIPGNRAISFSPKIKYGLYEVTTAENDFGPKPGEKLIFAQALAEESFSKAKLGYKFLRNVSDRELERISCAHPLRKSRSAVFEYGSDDYDFEVPLLEGDHVTEEAGTGFVHTAPGHGREDFEAWSDARRDLEARGIDTAIPYTVDADGRFTKDAPGFEGREVITDKGKKGDANQAVIDALIAADALFARGRLKHQYPHSWRSKKPVIFRNTPQWFVHMDRDINGPDDTLRNRALKAIAETRFVPAAGQNRLHGMIADRPDWVLSRQRAWGVPITVFVNKESGELLEDEAVDARVIEAFRLEGADAWFADDAKERFLGEEYSADDWEKVDDILDVWFDSGSTHSYVLEQREDLQWPASLYLEGSDQHRGWFHSSLLESCGTRGRAPYDAVLTHGFTMDEEGRKMSKSLGNQTFPQDVIKQYGTDILRLWVMSTDYVEDQRIGPEILKANAEGYRRLRNTIRFMLGNLANFEKSERVPVADMPELERWVLHRLWELDRIVRQGYYDFAFQKVFSALFNFCTVDLSSVYFDIRKDTLYCNPASDLKRRACRTVLDQVFETIVTWLAPMLCFTMEEAWLSRYPSDDDSIHLQQFKTIPADWQDDALGQKFNKARMLRRLVTGALEIERNEKRIGSSLEAAPVLYLSDPNLLAALDGIDLPEFCITSGFEIRPLDEAPDEVFRADDITNKAVVRVQHATGEKCARCWMVLPDVGKNLQHPDICARCASAI